jgi:flagellar basal-body rod protein FlgB
VTAIIDSNITSLLSLALDAAGMRQQAIAQNIANANTPGYRRIGVSFEQRFTELAQTGQGSGSPTLAELSHLHPRFEFSAAQGTGGAVSLDLEVADLSQTTVHHQALLKALNKHFALLNSAINEGKR